MTVEPREGYLAVTIELAAVPAGLSERARTLIHAFPAEHGVHHLRIDVRNRQWAAMVIEIVTTLRGSTPNDPATPSQN